MRRGRSPRFRRLRRWQQHPHHRCLRSTPLSQSEFVSQANAACQEGRTLAQKLSVGTDQGDTDAQALGLDECAKNVSPKGGSRVESGFWPGGRASRPVS